MVISKNEHNSFPPNKKRLGLRGGVLRAGTRIWGVGGGTRIALRAGAGGCVLNLLRARDEKFFVRVNEC